jgi:hypothetical protein
MIGGAPSARGNGATLESVLGASAEGQHVAQLYTEPDYARLDHAVESAYLEIFGVGRDAGFLRRTFIANYPRPAAMPDAQVAILAAQEFLPEAAAALLDRVRHHYYGPLTAA